MVELYILEREREQTQAAWEGRWEAELRRARRAERSRPGSASGPVAWLRGLLTGASRPSAVGRG